MAGENQCGDSVEWAFEHPNRKLTVGFGELSRRYKGQVLVVLIP